MSICILTFLLIGFVFFMPLQMKKNTLNTLGISVRSYKNFTSTMLSRYSAIFSNREYNHFLKIVWCEKPDPLNPDSGWGLHVSTTVFPLVGENIEIVPKNSIGYKMDRTVDGSTWDNNAYSYTDISSLFQGDSIIATNILFFASVYCFVSKDFDGTYVVISTEGEVSGKTIQEYDLNKKGIWQKLQIDFEAKSLIPPVYLYWSKYGVTDFSSLKGYVIFAYPQYGILTKNDSALSSLGTPIKNKIRDFINNDITKINKYFLTNNTIKNLDGINNLNHRNYDHNDECTPICQQKLITNSSDIYQYRSGLFTSSIPIITTLLSVGIDQDPVRKWAAKFISEDTTYYGYNQNLIVDKISNEFLGDRLLRWEFAYKIFINEYNWKQKTFGGGFSFLNWYGYYFFKDRTKSDWPHNPLLSILLYSGIIGLALYILFLYKVIIYYLLYLKENYLFFIFFLITFFFSFFSGGSPFDPPIMGFFMLLPFFIHHVHKSRDHE